MIDIMIVNLILIKKNTIIVSNIFKSLFFSLDYYSFNFNLIINYIKLL